MEPSFNYAPFSELTDAAVNHTLHDRERKETLFNVKDTEREVVGGLQV